MGLVISIPKAVHNSNIQKWCLSYTGVSEKLPVSKFRYLIQLYGYFYVHVSGFGEVKQFHEPWNLVVHVLHMLFVFFAALKNLKSSFSEDNMPVHVLDIFI